MKFRSITIPKDYGTQRVDKFCRKWFKQHHPDIALGQIYKWIRTGAIRVNDHKVKQKDKISPPDRISIPEIPKNEKSSQNPKTYNVPSLDPLVETDDRVVFNKPPGHEIHRNNKTTTRTMEDQLTRRSGASFCHRLDKQTSGILIAGKHHRSIQRLNKQIRERNVKKTYQCIVIGEPPASGMIDTSLKKVVDRRFRRSKMIADSQGQSAHTNFRVLQYVQDHILGSIALLEVEIMTGRMHQIRAHLSQEGYPVVGDIVYGLPSANRKLFKKYNIPNQCLHCREYSFQDLGGQTIYFTASPPKEWKKLF